MHERLVVPENGFGDLDPLRLRCDLRVDNCVGLGAGLNLFL